jgi:23S rRNA (uracil1939-C5)-methyltransferase
MPQATVCELYAGIGAIGLALAKKSKEVRLVEVEASAKEYFLQAQQKNGLHNLSYYVSRAEECVDLVVGADVCIVDPPRKGLGPELLRKIVATPGLKQLFYIACDYTSLQRDLEHLPPDWKVSWACSYLFFPGTNQIETAVLLSQIN